MPRCPSAGAAVGRARGKVSHGAARARGQRERRLLAALHVCAGHRQLRQDAFRLGRAQVRGPGALKEHKSTREVQVRGRPQGALQSALEAQVCGPGALQSAPEAQACGPGVHRGTTEAQACGPLGAHAHGQIQLGYTKNKLSGGALLGREVRPRSTLRVRPAVQCRRSAASEASSNRDRSGLDLQAGGHQRRALNVHSLDRDPGCVQAVSMEVATQPI